MHLTRLSLTNVRTYRRLELEPSRGIHVITGENAAGNSEKPPRLATHHASTSL